MNNVYQDLYLTHLSRGKTLDGGWLHGILHVTENGPCEEPVVDIYQGEKRKMVIPESVGDFTGLFDGMPADWIERFPDMELMLEHLKEYRGVPMDKETWKGTPVFEGDIIAVYDRDKIDELFDGTNIKPSYQFVIRKGIAPGALNCDTHGYPAYVFAGYDDETKKCVGFGCRVDPLYWLKNKDYCCIIVGNTWDREHLKH